MALKMWKKLPRQSLSMCQETFRTWRMAQSGLTSHSLNTLKIPSSTCICHAKFHNSALRNDSKKLAVKNQTKATDPEDEIELASKEITEMQADKTKVKISHVKRERPVPKEEKEYELPSHDEKRVTNQNRELEFKASSIFEQLARQRGATKQTFIHAVSHYIRKETLYRRGAVEFITAGMKQMTRFGVKRDLDAYKALLQVLPEGKLIPRNAWQVEFMHYPRQQQCIIDLLEQMEHNALIPDDEFGRQLRNRFGNEAHVTRKYRRMMYWLPKFKNMNPYPVPYEMPKDQIELALLALKRMTVDKETVYKVWKTADLEETPEEDTFIASAQSPTQQRLLHSHNVDDPLFVEGPFPVFMRNVFQKYFLLRAEPNMGKLKKQQQVQEEEENDDNLFEWKNFFEEEHYTELLPVLSVHEQEDGTVLGYCITGSNSKSSVVRWIHCLQQFNPKLSKTPVLFQLTQGDSELQPMTNPNEEGQS